MNRKQNKNVEKVSRLLRKAFSSMRQVPPKEQRANNNRYQAESCVVCPHNGHLHDPLAKG